MQISRNPLDRFSKSSVCSNNSGSTKRLIVPSHPNRAHPDRGGRIREACATPALVPFKSDKPTLLADTPEP